MSETKFTPGPWRVFEDVRTERNPYSRDSEEYIAGFDVESNNYEVVGCEGISGGGDIERANAHLIAAAPELYEALENIIKIVDNDFYLNPISTAITHARSILAKARGETS